MKTVFKISLSIFVVCAYAIAFFFAVLLSTAALMGFLGMSSEWDGPIWGLMFLGFIAATTFTLDRVWRDSSPHVF